MYNSKRTLLISVLVVGIRKTVTGNSLQQKAYRIHLCESLASNGAQNGWHLLQIQSDFLDELFFSLGAIDVSS